MLMSCCVRSLPPRGQLLFYTVRHGSVQMLQWLLEELGRRLDRSCLQVVWRKEALTDRRDVRWKT